MVAIPFLGILGAICEVALVSFNAERLQAVVDRAARQVLTGQAQARGFPSVAAFKSALLCPTDGTSLLPASWDCSKLIVDVRTASDFASVDVRRGFYAGLTKFCLGNPSTVVVLRVAYPMPAMSPLSINNRYVGLANDVPNLPGFYHVLTGAAVMRTEAYQGSAPAC